DHESSAGGSMASCVVDLQVLPSRAVAFDLSAMPDVQCTLRTVFVTNTVRETIPSGSLLPLNQKVIMDTATTTRSSTAAQLYSMRWIVAAVVLAANTMDLLDATIVNVAGPAIHRELGGGASTIQWLSAAYTLAFAVLLIAGARLGDIFGRRRMFLLGLAGFIFFSA